MLKFDLPQMIADVQSGKVSLDVLRAHAEDQRHSTATAQVAADKLQMRVDSITAHIARYEAMGAYPEGYEIDMAERKAKLEADLVTLTAHLNTAIAKKEALYVDLTRLTDACQLFIN